MIDILLISPPLMDYDKKHKPWVFVNASLFPPIGLAYISSYLELHNYKTKIVDMDIEKYGLSIIPHLIRIYKPRLIGIGIISDIVFPISVEIIQKIKEITNIPVIVGGNFPSFNPVYMLESSNADYVVRGEGEITLLELAHLLIKEEGDINKIQGVSYKENSNIVHNPERDLIKNLDSLPLPAWDQFDIKKYFISISYKNPSFAITASRGCPHNCIFCVTSVFNFHRIRSPENVIKEIEYLIREYGIKDITFHDPCFNVKPKWVISFCKEILRRKIRIKWRCICRVDNITDELLYYMKSAGCYNISLGVESSQDKFLKFLRKGFTIEQVENAFKLVKKYQIETLAFFMMGIPGQNIADLKHTIKFMKKLKPDFVQILILNPLMGTDLYKLAKEKGWLMDHDVATLKNIERIAINQLFWNIPNLNLEIIAYYIRRAYISYFLSLSAIIKHSSRYIRKPSRFFNTLRNLIRRYSFKDFLI